MSICLDTVPALETQMDGWMDGWKETDTTGIISCSASTAGWHVIIRVKFLQYHLVITALQHHLEMRIRQIMTLFGIRSMEYVLQQLTDITEVAAQVCDRHI